MANNSFNKHSWIFLALFLSLNLIQAEESSVKEYRITDSKGPTGVVPGGTKEASPAVVGMRLIPGDHVVTGNKGRVELATKDGSVLELREKSSLKVEKVAEYQNIFALKIGKLLARFAPAPQKRKGFYLIRTPACIGAVKGTELALSVDENGAVQGGVVEGEVDFDTAENLEDYEKAEGVEESISTSASTEAIPVPAVPEISSGTTPVQTEVSTAPMVAVSTEIAQKEETIVGANGGIVVDPGQKPRKIAGIPPLLVGELVWFKSLRERIPELRSQWKDMDFPSQLKMRQEALRERVKWNVPAKYLLDLVPPSKQIPPMPRPDPFSPRAPKPDNLKVKIRLHSPIFQS
ncbi:MAG: FecR domain-containing protein [Elusimicrobia bacterium]|nr:FecR domain-containing protein [Candidatus Obscuribacterium magneticum]